MTTRRSRCACGNCKRCEKREYDRARYLEKREEIIERGRAYYLENRERKQAYDAERRNGDERERILAEKRAYYEANAEVIKPKNLEYYHANQESIAEQSRKYYEENREHIQHRTRLYYLRNRDKYRANTKTWNQRNPERRRASGLAHQNARRGAPYTPLGREYAEQVLSGDPCSYCGGPAGTIDHIDPIASGGDGDWPNLTAACGSCNSSKNARPMLLFMALRQEGRALVEAEAA